MTNTISNQDDTIDSRDIISRLEELQTERDDLQENYELADTADKSDTARRALDNWENAKELKALTELAEECEGYSGDWIYGETLINRDYFVEYCKELVSDIGDIPRDIPSYIEIDWEATASNLEA